MIQTEEAGILSAIQSKIINYPLVEQDIISLHQKFLTNGLQYITVKNVLTGRMIVQSLLESLQIYQDVAVITMEDAPLHSTIFNVCQQLVPATYFGNFDDEQLDALLYEYFNFDFMWIEATDELLHNRWYAGFEQKIHTLRLYHHMPIICVSYNS